MGKFSKETEEKLSKSLDEMAKDRRKERGEKKNKTKKSEKKETKSEKRKKPAEERERAPSVRLTIEGETMKKLFIIAGCKKDLKGYPAINVTISKNMRV